MIEKINRLLADQEENHLLPFLWVHGESEVVYRDMIRAIRRANIGAFCVEARPHPGFCKDTWWRDMDIILDEAEKLGMKVWILDDKHFPTGYANGAVEKAPLALRRQNLCAKEIKIKKGRKRIVWSLLRLAHPKSRGMFVATMNQFMGNTKKANRFHDDSLFSCTAFSQNQRVDLSEFIHEGKLDWTVPEGEWTICLCFLSRNVGAHRGYINMMDKESCQIQMDAVYEPHYHHYKEKFGSTIAGFFSDEPELGNDYYFGQGNVLGTDHDLPWSRELEKELSIKLGSAWKSRLSLLWHNGFDPIETARVRYVFMDLLTRLVEKDFSHPLGEWCRSRGVEYIGHVIEDNNQHARTGSSLGHFFRGLSGQDMSGIDDIGGQVVPQKEDDNHIVKKFPFLPDRDGEFYHYALGKLGSSLGALLPSMKGRTMCEIFGNYGWSEGVRLEKYLIDHFMVRGINYFVPHAFTSKAYPDPDCPPHFYAHGNHPQYRHFGQIMKYANRVCTLISGGHAITPVAVLYHAEAEWTGKCMLMQKPARILADHQIDFHFVPSDAFGEPDRYQTVLGKTLRINRQEFQMLIVPYSQFLPKETAEAVSQLHAEGFKTVFIDSHPDGLCTGEALPEGIRKCPVVRLAELSDYLTANGLKTIFLNPESDRIRILHYAGEADLFYLSNESDKAYSGKVLLPKWGDAYEYDAWKNAIHHISKAETESGTWVEVNLPPSHSLLVIFDTLDETKISEKIALNGEKIPLQTFEISHCRSLDYPAFSQVETVTKSNSYSEINPKFSGFLRYRTIVNLPKWNRAILEIADAHEGVEVFVNGKSCGIQVVPPFLYDISDFLQAGDNEIGIEVATTLERERSHAPEKVTSPTGITGAVTLFIQ